MTKFFSLDINNINYNAGFSGKIKDVNGVNGTPRSIAPGFPDLEDQFNQLGIKHFRFHDNLGFGDIDNYFVPNDTSSQFLPSIPTEKRSAALSLIADLGNRRTIFPNAAIGMRQHNEGLALSNANYAMTDQHFREVLNNNPSVNPNNVQREILFRVGRTNRGGAEPPEDFDIYASMARAVAERYSRDYQQTGLPRKVAYWEIWNEPDLTIFWNNNNQQVFYQFFEKVARAIKAADPAAKVGGAGVATGYNPGGAYTDGLLSYCRQNNVPLDFYSWHYYANKTADPQNIIDYGDLVQSTLNKYGYNNIESIVTEWNVTPFADINVFSKLQSATNAAYIVSSLIYMNYTKVDKSYYYRGDASSFGLFNNEPGFCSYAAQGFYLYSKLFETPNILAGGQDFSSGISLIAGKNDANNQINVLVANYEVDMRNTRQTPPTSSPLYAQHYVDGNRQISQLTDQWSLNEWFGGVNPNTINPNNAVTQKQTVTQLPTNGSVNARTRDYTASSQGVQFSINNISQQNFRLSAWRVKEGGELYAMTPADVSSSVAVVHNGTTVTITDPGATKSTVTLYTLHIDGTNNPANNNPPTNNNPPANNKPPVNTNNNMVLSAGRIALTRFFPSDTLSKGRSYKLTFTLPEGVEILRCPNKLVFNGDSQYCQLPGGSLTNDYSYEPTSGTLTLLVDNVKGQNAHGSYYIFVPPAAAGQVVHYNFSAP
ncbi:glycoside hydrolase family 39 [Acetobacteraceae bacterium ESL0709]|nr:glycoside hydrolase family 39 [Acetobacteraceae bacterium ESL0697]MDF7677637.1 glycoside hydrolase family 39 [Acetobacteraceae bacterium ESL0709]